jgi:hypothetical protein
MRAFKLALVGAVSIGLGGCYFNGVDIKANQNGSNFCQHEPIICAAALGLVVGGAIGLASAGHHHHYSHPGAPPPPP